MESTLSFVIIRVKREEIVEIRLGIVGSHVNVLDRILVLGGGMM